MNNSSGRKKLAVGTMIYAIGTFGQKILMFLMVPLYTYYLKTDEMGVYDVLTSAISILVPIITLQISDAIYRWFITETVDKKEYLRVTYSFLFFSSIIALIILVIINYVVKIPYFYYFLWALYSSLFFQTCQKIVRGLGRQWLFAVSGIVYTIVFIILNLVQLMGFNRGVYALFISLICANVVGICVIFIAERNMRVSIIEKSNYSILKDLIRYSCPLIPNYLNWWVVDMSDKYVVLFFLGLDSNGILAVVYKFPAILQAVYGVFLNSWQDYAITMREKAGSFFSSVFKTLYRMSFMGLWIVVPITKVFVCLFMAEEYKIACDYTPYYYLGAVFQAFCSFYGVGYLRNKRTKGALFSSIYGAIINIVLNLVLIQFIGLHAAAISTFVSFLIMWIIRERQNKTELSITINWKEFVLLVILDIIVCLISIRVNVEYNILLAVLGGLLFVIFNLNNIKMMVNMLKYKKRKRN